MKNTMVRGRKKERRKDTHRKREMDENFIEKKKTLRKRVKKEGHTNRKRDGRIKCWAISRSVIIVYWVSVLMKIFSKQSYKKFSERKF